MNREKDTDDGKIIRFGLIGCGRIAPRHVLAINSCKNAKLIAVCDNVKSKAVDFSKKYGVEKVYSDYKKMLRDADIDAVTICTPSGLHAQMTIDAANSKKHVVTEKPMALTLKGADKMIESCKKNDIRLFVVKQNRYNPPVKELRKAIDSGRFGKIFLVNTTVRWCRPKEYYAQDKWRGTWRMDGGVFMNQASHHIDLVRWIGGEVKSVIAVIDNFTHPEIEVEDTGAAIIKFKNGAVGVIETTNSAFPKNMEGSVTVLGEKGSAKVGGFAVNNMETWEFADYDNDDEIFRRKSTTPPDVYGYGHIEFFKNVIGSILENKDPLVSGIEGRKTLELITALYKSAKEKKEIFLPLKE
jgi:predicted dehydrogenase